MSHGATQKNKQTNKKKKTKGKSRPRLYTIIGMTHMAV